MDVGKIDSLIVQDFTDIFSSSDLNIINTNTCFDWGCTCARQSISKKCKSSSLQVYVSSREVGVLP